MSKWDKLKIAALNRLEIEAVTLAFRLEEEAITLAFKAGALARRMVEFLKWMVSFGAGGHE